MRVHVTLCGCVGEGALGGWAVAKVGGWVCKSSVHTFHFISHTMCRQLVNV